MSVKDQFEGAIFEGVLLGATTPAGRGSSFGTVYNFNLPVYDPLNPANVMTRPAPMLDGDDNRPSP